MIRRITAMLAALIMAATAFTSCSNSDTSSSNPAADSGNSSSDGSSSPDSSGDDSSAADTSMPDPSLNIDGQEIDTTDLVMCTIGGRDVKFDMYRYYYYYVLNIYAQNYNITPEQLATSSEAYDLFKSHVIEQIKQDFVALDLAEQHDIKLTDEDIKAVDDKIAEFKAKYSTDEAFNEALKAACLNPDLYKHMMEHAQLYQKVENELLVSGGKLATPSDEFKTIVQDTDKYSRVIHILIPYYSQAEIKDEKVKTAYDSYSLYEKGNAKQDAYNELSEDEQKKVKEASKKVADEVLEKAKNGDDFESLIKEYGWDPGMESEPTGYYVNENTSFVKEFKEMCFKLKVDEISDLVESGSYGWFIIKRLPVDMEYVEKNIDSLINDYDMPRINELYTDMMDKMEVKESEYLSKMKPDSLT